MGFVGAGGDRCRGKWMDFLDFHGSLWSELSSFDSLNGGARRWDTEKAAKRWTSCMRRKGRGVQLLVKNSCKCLVSKLAPSFPPASSSHLRLFRIHGAECNHPSHQPHPDRTSTRISSRAGIKSASSRLGRRDAVRRSRPPSSLSKSCYRWEIQGWMQLACRYTLELIKGSYIRVYWLLDQSIDNLRKVLGVESCQSRMEALECCAYIGLPCHARACSMPVMGLEGFEMCEWNARWRGIIGSSIPIWLMSALCASKELYFVITLEKSAALNF